jgi:hypothetical protein
VTALKLPSPTPDTGPMGARLSAAVAGATAAIACATALVFAPAALADTTTSSNWAGYGAHGTGVSFRTVQGTWRQPGMTCASGVKTYSSYWVGLGGYSVTSKALEQIGTEADCSAGQVRLSAWYELVPAPSVPIQLTINPGDVMTASVTVSGQRVSVSLIDLTRKHSFTKTVSASPIDVTSAEWIVEAPSECVSANACVTLPLANFGSAAFSSALASSTAGVSGGIANPAWQTTKIKLVPATRRFISVGSPAPSVGIATPSSLGAGGRSFTVSYSEVPATIASRFFAKQRSTLTAGALLHPTR